jgi:crossover junction endodeoxyribonuclease RusA
MMRVSFFAAGKPETKGSARAFVVKGRAVITNANPRAKTWAGIVTTQALDAMGRVAPFPGPVDLYVKFTLPRPKSHYRTGRHGHLLREDAPSMHSGKPDLDKLLRCLKDSLTGVCYGDDGQVWSVTAFKQYGERLGASVVVCRSVNAWIVEVNEAEGTMTVSDGPPKEPA